MEAVKAGYVEIVVIAVIFSAVSAYFYLRIVMYMYMREPKEDIMLKALSINKPCAYYSSSRNPAVWDYAVCSYRSG